MSISQTKDHRPVLAVLVFLFVIMVVVSFARQVMAADDQPGIIAGTHDKNAGSKPGNGGAHSTAGGIMDGITNYREAAGDQTDDAFSNEGNVGGYTSRPAQ